MYLPRVSTREPHSPRLSSEKTSHEAKQYQERKGNNRQKMEMKIASLTRYVVPMMHPFVLNNDYKAMVFPLREFYPRSSLPLFLPQSRGLPSRPYPGHEHHYVIAPGFKCLSLCVLFTHTIFTSRKRYMTPFQRDSVLER